MKRHIRVGFAIPRKQVVIQLSERIKKYFPSSNVKAIHAEAKNERDAHIVVMTIQQLVNYKDEFGLLLIDEVDAFPFADSPFYWRLANQALRAGGSLILISATLTSALKRKLTKADFVSTSIRLVSRVDHDLPRFLQLSGSALETILESILPILKKWRSDSKRAILFLPSIAKCLAFASLLRKEGVKARAVTSETERKEAIIHEFSAGNLDVLVSTSILERGITFSGIQIAVLQADSPLYDRDTLIQMSGRVGRDLWEPRGEIWFLSEYLSPAMRKARAEIRMLNRRKTQAVIEMRCPLCRQIYVREMYFDFVFPDRLCPECQRIMDAEYFEELILLAGGSIRYRYLIDQPKAEYDSYLSYSYTFAKTLILPFHTTLSS